MGKNNKSRRAAKAKKRRQKAKRHSHGAGTVHEEDGGAADGPLSDGDVILAAVRAEHQKDDHQLSNLLAVLLEQPRQRVAMELQAQLERQVAWIWDYGWQPGDALQHVTRTLGNGGAEILRCAVTAQATEYEHLGETVAPAWMAQLADHGAERWWDHAEPWAIQIGRPFREVLAAGIRVLCLFRSSPVLPQLVPPPSKWSSLASVQLPTGAYLAPGILQKIRSLLAKAESTSFDAEAEAFTAKAQELMTRHRIDRVTAVDGEPIDDVVVGRRIWIDNPYPEAKTALLAGIAHANGCRSVWTKNLGFVTLFGFVDDLDGVEEIFTSLLVQATSALQREGSRVDRYGRSRTTRFRRSFLVAFADRIAERLREATDETVRSVEDETGRALVPVLASRERAADKAVQQAFGDLKPMSLSVTDPEGYRLGVWFGDRADLGVGDEPRPLGSLTSGARAPR